MRWMRAAAMIGRPTTISSRRRSEPMVPAITRPEAMPNERSRADLKELWPIARFPVLRDEAADRTIPESSIIIEYLAQHHPGPVRLLPADPDLARQTRLRDRFYDLYIDVPMQKIVFDRLRPAGRKDPAGVDDARATLRTAYAMIEREMATKTWAADGGIGEWPLPGWPRATTTTSWRGSTPLWPSGVALARGPCSVRLKVLQWLGRRAGREPAH